MGSNSRAFVASRVHVCICEYDWTGAALLLTGIAVKALHPRFASQACRNNDDDTDTNAASGV